LRLALPARGERFPGSEVLSRRAFKNAAVWEKCALLTVITATLGLSRDNSAHFCRVGCLSPHNCLA
jgi:hypothetical protein